MKTMLKFAPLVALVVMMSACGGGGGTPDPRNIGHAVFSKIVAKDFDSLDGYLDTWGSDTSAYGEWRAWRIKEGYDRWSDYKKGLEGDNGTDPKSKSGIDGEEKWKEMSRGKSLALGWGLYKLYAVDDLDKRLGEAPWYWSARQELGEEGQGEARMTFTNAYRDQITVSMVRREGLWYLSGVNVEFEKELPKKPKDD